MQDVQEVAAQGIRSVPKFLDQEALERAVLRRVQRPRPSRFVVGGAADLDACLRAMRDAGAMYRVCLVQPGISASGASADVFELLGAVDTYARENGCEPLSVIASA